MTAAMCAPFPLATLQWRVTREAEERRALARVAEVEVAGVLGVFGHGASWAEALEGLLRE
jgi:hypothetical protein